MAFALQSFYPQLRITPQVGVTWDLYDDPNQPRGLIASQTAAEDEDDAEVMEGNINKAYFKVPLKKGIYVCLQ